MDEVQDKAVERVSEITGLSRELVRQYLDNGWSFYWDIRGNYSWTLPTQEIATSNVMENFIEVPYMASETPS